MALDEGGGEDDSVLMSNRCKGVARQLVIFTHSESCIICYMHCLSLSQ